MRKTIHFLVLMVAALTAVLAHGQVVDPYEVMQVTPAEGEVSSLQHFTITFAGLPVEVNEQAIPSLEKGGGNTVEGRMWVGEDGTTVEVDFDELFTASGHYFLNLPENSITVKGQRLLPLSLRFIIKGDMDSFYEQITIDPAQGEVESLQYFTISLPEYVAELAMGRNATLTNNTTGNSIPVEMNSVGYKVLVYASSEITESGEYTLTIPEGAIMIYTLDEVVHELSFNYTIVNDGPSFYEQITIDPAEGPVKSLQAFTVTFPEPVDAIVPGSKATLTNTETGTVHETEMTADGNKVQLSCADQVTEAGRYTLTIPAASVIIDALGEDVHELQFNYIIAHDGMPSHTINPAEGEMYYLQYFTIGYNQRVIVDEDMHPVLSNDETGETFECNLMEIGGNAVIYKEYPLSVLGSYTLTVPEGCITIEATGQQNPEMTFHYVIVEKEIYIPPVIEVQPEGELRLYQRSGGLVREVEREAAEDDDDLYELVYERQEGVLSIVFGAENKVYIQRPVSWIFYDGWIEGTLSEDGKTITVPMGQYIAYAKSLEMGVQVAVFTYDGNADTYVYDDSVTELTYTINDDGTITLNGTSTDKVLGAMNRAFGQNFQYLDFEWLQSGDYASTYLPIDEVPMTPPDGMEVESYYLSTAINDGMEWEPYRTQVKVGFDGNDMWLQGISSFVPMAWIKGEYDGEKVTFSNPQLLGSNDVLFYFKCAEFNPLNGNTVQKDMVLTMENGDFKTFDYIFITTDKDNLYFANYYQGLTLSKFPDRLLRAPEDLKIEEYEFSYKTLVNPNLPAVEGSHSVDVGFDDDWVYIRGLWPNLPNAWVYGRLNDDKIVMDLPQFMGNYKEEYSGTYPIYLGTFDQTNGSVLSQVIFDFNEETGAFSASEQPFSIGINKTGYLSLMDYTDMLFTPVNSSVKDIKADADAPDEYYDLQGRRLTDISNATGIIIVKHADGTATKVLKR